MTKILKNNGKILKTVSFANTGYGLLYNWYAGTHADKISSSDDWVLPTSANFNTLATYLGATVAGGYMKETGTTYWQSQSAGCDNSAKFNGRGGGYRGNSFAELRYFNRMMTSTVYFVTGYVIWQLNYGADTFITPGGYPKYYGTPIRLLYTGAGTPTSYTGNDGKVYRVVLIGTQYWLADNLAETKYRNGNNIPEITNNTDWGNDTTGALCAYNNDWNNVGTITKTTKILKTV